MSTYRELSIFVSSSRPVQREYVSRTSRESATCLAKFPSVQPHSTGHLHNRSAKLKVPK
jgi:hypothetical protein